MGSKGKKAVARKKTMDDSLDSKVFFVIKFWLMSAFQGIVMVLIVFFLGTIDAIQLIIIGIVLFVVSLVVSTRFDKNITWVAVKIGKRLAKYPKVEKLLLKSI
jgi:ABC-type multidrug transport system fused ATPase/permease subunit